MTVKFSAFNAQTRAEIAAAISDCILVGLDTSIADPAQQNIRGTVEDWVNAASPFGLRLTGAAAAGLKNVTDNAATPNATQLWLSTNKTAIETSLIVGDVAVPGAQLHVKGQGDTSATINLLLKSFSGTQIFKVEDGGNVLFGSSGQSYFNSNGDLIGDTWKSKTSFSDDKLFWGADNLQLTFANNLHAFWSPDGFKIGNGAIATGVDSAALIEMISTTRGLLLPRMTTAQKNAIGTPKAGLLIFDTDLAKLCVYTTAWETVTSV